jgi:hypothetical protein
MCIAAVGPFRALHVEYYEFEGWQKAVKDSLAA